MNDVPVLTISELTRQLKELVEANFPQVRVTGEISNFVRASSGHLYFTLKDQRSQIRAVMWRNAAQRLKFDLHDGLEVVASGPIEIYAPRGSYQLMAEQILPQGVGVLELALRQLQEKLAAEGLFNPERKRSLPRFPRRIVLVTSPTSAAVRDMLQVLTRRWTASDIVILPVRVQGDGAANDIAKALAYVPNLPNVDLVITGRGGGSLEDLWAFNEEVVARAIAACPIPVISAVGHEIDVTIADMVADHRALTPSEAAELAVPLQAEIRQWLDSLREQLASGLHGQAARARAVLDSFSDRRPFRKPTECIHLHQQQLDDLSTLLQRAMKRRLEMTRDKVGNLASAVETLSPLGVLQRGYSITRKAESGDIVREVTDVQPGDDLETILPMGSIISRVEQMKSESGIGDSIIQQNTDIT